MSIHFQSRRTKHPINVLVSVSKRSNFYTSICYAATKQVFSDALHGSSEMITVIMHDVDYYMTEAIAR